MIYYKAYQFRLYPNNKQKKLIHQTFGSCRYVFNHFLNRWEDEYQTNGVGLTFNKCSLELTKLKKEKEWLREVDSVALQSALKELDAGYRNFYQHKKNPPKYRSQKDHEKSYTTRFSNKNILVFDSKVQLPKLGKVKAAVSKDLEGRVLNATVRQRPSGKYFVALLCEINQEEGTVDNKNLKAVGIDLGLSHFAVLSDGTRINNPRFFESFYKKLSKEQRILSRRKKLAIAKKIKLLDSKNYQKQRVKVSRIHETIKNRREDFLNKVTTDLVEKYDIICLESLDIESIKQHSNFSAQVNDVSWYSFTRKLEYKASWANKKVVRVSQWYPSSQICSHCEEQSTPKKLSEREWQCFECNTLHDRDGNAAKNIEREGLRVLQNT